MLIQTPHVQVSATCNRVSHGRSMSVNPGSKNGQTCAVTPRSGRGWPHTNLSDRTPEEQWRTEAPNETGSLLALLALLVRGPVLKVVEGIPAHDRRNQAGGQGKPKVQPEADRKLRCPQRPVREAERGPGAQNEWGPCNGGKLVIWVIGCVFREGAHVPFKQKLYSCNFFYNR